MQTFLLAIAVFVFCTLSLVCMRWAALKFRLLDAPNQRKSHQGHIPLVGGLSTFFGIWLIHIVMPDLLWAQIEYMCLMSLLVLLGMLDDKLDLNALSRLIVISVIAGWLVYVEDISLFYLGDFLGLGDISLGYSSVVFTVLSIIASITAFNMVDGIDGLLGALAAISLGGLGILFWLSGNTQLSLFCTLFTVSMLPYLCFNLGLHVKPELKVFMGDSGSFLVGFTVIWLLMFATQPMAFDDINVVHISMKPVTSLWLIAIPIMDMIRVMFVRLYQGQSPLKADRNHVHHLLLDYGYSPKRVLFTLTSMAFYLAAFGVLMEVVGVDEVVSFSVFFIGFMLYCSGLKFIEVKIKKYAKARKSTPIINQP